MARSLLPFGLRSDVAQSDDPFGSLRREMSRVFDDAFRDFFAPMRGAAGGGMLAPSMDVRETDNAYEIEAELPGVDEKDIQVMLENDTLTIKGEKKAEREQTEKGYRISERSYGSFYRSIAVPPGTDPQKVEASFSKGVLKITLPKPSGDQAKAKNIEVKAS